MRQKIRSIIRGASGFTLIEMIISLAIFGMMSVGITSLICQTVTGTQRDQLHLNVIQQVDNAGYWLSRDVAMAENISVGSGAGFPIQLTWNTWGGDQYLVSFSLTNGSIERSLVKNGNAAGQTVVAQSINSDPGLTNCSYSNGMLSLQVTATLGTVSETRNYQIKARPE
jgi:prepilin-type N-terminal cleavage/methylation domain-containing protein